MLQHGTTQDKVLVKRFLQNDVVKMINEDGQEYVDLKIKFQKAVSTLCISLYFRH